ncbi:SDR family NAD(P)-dependent oxidoreductase [Paenibacillus beijingensis]|uniref:Short-chain dehydrogenase n=1 Tax=Paenibacillus beijingensis TaxID=1126833 RepID=A0A0D5NKZ6_9BACL|nr:SDR family oxidoreductase [Paenibacillus beijingensis]AJY76024.1 short-chain dehydrogenase [Paenibacillus beijingensis]
MRLNNKRAIVTGAGRGIGFQIAKRFAEEGARVVATDVLEAGAEAVSVLSNAGLDIVFHRADVSQILDVRELAEFARRTLGGVDILVNNAAVNIPGSILELTEEIWDRTFDVNVKSIFLLSREIIPDMRGAGGVVINMGSANSYVAEPRLAAYVSSKGAILMLSKAMALDFGPDGIRVNCICPGWVDTSFNDRHAELFGGRDEVLKNIADIHPIGRTIQPEEIANTAVFLASDEARAITGAGILVDGGYTIK